MKVALITEIVNSKSGSRAPIEIAKHLASQKIMVQIIAYSYNLDKNLVTELKKQGIEVKLFEKRKIASIIKMAKYINQEKFDLISFHGTLYSFLSAKLTGLPIVCTYYGTQFD